jgi:hypothetical protein
MIHPLLPHASKCPPGKEYFWTDGAISVTLNVFHHAFWNPEGMSIRVAKDNPLEGLKQANEEITSPHHIFHGFY